MGTAALHHWIALTAAVTLFFLLLAVFWLVRGLRQRREDRLMQRVGVEPVEDKQPNIRIRSKKEPLRGWISSLPLVQRIRLVLERSGLHISLSRLAAAGAVAAVLTGLLTVVATESVILALTMSAATVLGIYGVIARRQGIRVKQVSAQLPTALEMMIFSMRAGQNLEEAIRAAAVEVEAPLSTELARCYQEYEMGRPIEAALQQARIRWQPVRTFASFVEAVVVLKRTGGNIIEVMELLVESLESQTTFEAKYRALTAEGRLSGTVLMLLPLLVLVIQILLSPQQLAAMLKDGMGQWVLITAVGLWATGIAWVARLVRPVQ